jgi:tetratricopeptide (TPR) repeat protein
MLIAVLGVVVLAEAGLSYQRNQLYSSAIGIWKDTAEKSPGKVRPRFQLAYAYYQAQQCSEAVEQYAKAAELQKPKYDLLLDWALAYDCAGKPGQAIATLKQAVATTKNAHVYSQIGMEYGKQGNYPEAMDALATAEKLDPKFAMTYVYRGNIFEVQGNATGAAGEYQRALAADPYNQPARDGLTRLGR